MNIDNISIAISQGLKYAGTITHNFVKKVMTGTATARDVMTYEQYDRLFKLRHDIIHWLICEHREIPFGERHVEDIEELKILSTHKYYSEVKKQSPDIIVIEGKQVKITELTVSRIKYADAPKISKYRLLCNVMEESGLTPSLEVIVINTAYSYPDFGHLQHHYGFSDRLIFSIYDVIEKVENLLHLVHETKQGQEYASQRDGHITDIVNFPITDEDVITFYEKCEAKPFNSSEDLKTILNSKVTPVITKGDDRFINKMVEMAINVNSGLYQSQSAHQPIKDLKDHHQKNAKYGDKELRSFMPLPYFEERVVDSAVRRTHDDVGKFTILIANLQESQDPLLGLISTMKNPIDNIKIPNYLKYEIALQGPGRRRYVQSGSQPHIEKQRDKKGFWLPVENPWNQEVHEMSYLLSQIENDEKDPLLLTGAGIRYIKICQSIFREININSLRSERRSRFILKPTGIDGLFVFLHKGPKLRTGENLSIIWFKLILLKENFKTNRMTNSWIFKTLHSDKNVYHSNWLSTDANRLDHYIRCYDKILMAFACYNSMSEISLMRSMCSNDSNTLGIIIMIYMENKRSTSKMLQDVRYLVMTALSMYQYYGDVLKKFIDPIRSVLQSYLLDRILKFTSQDKMTQHVMSSEFGRLNVEAGTGETFDRFAGAKIQMPRVLTDGPVINFKQLLCEMYFTMLFNKNQDDPTHASFQILSKILEGEKSLEYVKQNSRLHTGFHNGHIQDLKELVMNPHKNQFSRRAIMIASKLQATSKFNKSNSGIAHSIASKSHQINKTIDEFATYKSSSTLINDKYNPDVRQNKQTIEIQVKDNIISNNQLKLIKVKVSANQGVQNPRRRCLEGVKELLDRGISRSFDIVMQELYSRFAFQIFKKNQIGGVREILILDINKRILINILESFSRVICKDDDREMLTHGDRKLTLMRDLIRHLKRGGDKKIIMNYNFDKTKWAPSFMPIQFLYMFLPFKSLYPSLFRFICVSLINHSNKRFILPERLIRVWNNDLTNQFQHYMDPNLQKLKELYLHSKELTYLNESNMGQGILHYTSSFFHLCVVSLRDEIYKRLCAKFEVSTGEWRDLVSSDDSYTAHALPLDNIRNVKTRILLFLKAQEVVERSMNVWTSTSKSSISALIYEFNSLFGSNLTMFPTTFKFALASVQPLSTDSFFRMTKEGYISCRQIVENGGSLELYILASRLNKQYAESIYHTNVGGQNDLTQHGLQLSHIPYQLGVYPIMDPVLMLMFGPECHNYNIINNMHELSEQEAKLFKIMHTLVELSDPEVYASMGKIDDIFVGVHRIEAHTGPIRRLEYIKRNVVSNWEEIQEMIIKDPLVLFRDPVSLDEIKLRVFSKLYQNSAAEALRTTAASIYYGRVAATVSAKAFVIPFVSAEPMTYQDCLMMLLSKEPNPIDLGLLYPALDDFKKIQVLSKLEFDYNDRNPFETQNIRMLQLVRDDIRFHNPLTKVLSHYWSDDPGIKPNSYVRDWINLQNALPIFQPTLNLTLDQLSGDRPRKIKTLILLILRMMGASSKPMKAIVYGPSSRSIDDTYLILKQQNLFHDRTSNQSRGLYMSEITTRINDKLCYAFNIFAMAIITNVKIPDVTTLFSDDDINNFFMDNSLNIATYKKILLMLIYFGKVSDAQRWSEKTKTIFHHWDLRSVKSEESKGIYDGSFKVRLQLGSVIMAIDYHHSIKGRSRIRLYINRVDDYVTTFQLLERAIELSGFERDYFLKLIHVGSFLITDKMIIPSPMKDGKEISIKWLTPVRFSPGKVIYEKGFLSLLDRRNTVILNTIEGLLHTNYVPDDLSHSAEISVQGIPINRIIKHRPFNTHFSIEHIRPDELCRIIRIHPYELRKLDLLVPPPMVQDITNKRLGIELKTRSYDIEFSDIITEEVKIDDQGSGSDEEEKTTTLGTESVFDLFKNLATFDPKNVFDKVLEQDNGGFHDIWFQPTLDSNIVRTMTRQRIIYQPKKILEKILHFKYSLITTLVTNVNLLNKRAITSAQAMLKDKNVVYSLIYAYDTQFSNIEAPSPDGCEIRVHPEFDNYYFKTSDEKIII